MWLKFCPGSLTPRPNSPGKPDLQSLQSKQSAMAQGRKNLFVVMNIHTSDAVSPQEIFHFHLCKFEEGSRFNSVSAIWCDVQVKTLQQMVENETGRPPSFQHWMLLGCNVVGAGDPFGLAQEVSGNEFLFELDDGGVKRFIPYQEFQRETLGLNFRVHCSMPEAREVAHVGGRPRAERIRTLTLPTLLRAHRPRSQSSPRAPSSPRRPLPEDQETIYWVSEDEEMEHEREGERDDLPVRQEDGESPSRPSISENGESADVEEEEEEGWGEEFDAEICPTCGRDIEGFFACPACDPEDAFA